MEKNIEKVPTWALCYLVYGDSTGLTDEEIYMIDKLCQKQRIELVCPITDCVEGGTQPYFTPDPFFGQPTEVEDCVVVYNI